MTWMDCTLTLLRLNERFVKHELSETVTTSNCHVHFVRQNITFLLFITFDGQENCSACSQVPQDLQFPPSAKLQEVLEYLTENASL